MSSLRTRPLAHRLLFPSLPPDAQLPPLVASPELSAELYDLVALSLRAYVVPWWSKLSRYDKQFLPQITRILTTLIHHLDRRIHAAPIAPLLCAHVPAIITQHYIDYRNAHDKLGTSYATGAAASLPRLFHQLQPHIAVSADGCLDPEYFRQLIDHILEVCLPPEDFQPEAERFIIREIILKVLLTDVIPKVSQPWFIQKSILDLLQLHDQPPPPLRLPSFPSENPFSFHIILVALLSAIQAVSGACLTLIHAYKNTLSTIKRVNQVPPSALPFPHPHNLVHPLLTMLLQIFTLHHRLASTIVFTILCLFTDLFASFIDRLLPYLLTSLLSPSFILSTTRTAKRNLFPNGYPGPPPVEPSPEEQAEIQSRLIAWRPAGALVPSVLPFILGPDPARTLEQAVSPLSNAPCNVHLVLFLLDCVVVTLFPEIPVASYGRDQNTES